jgi:KAP family P-loop domain
MKFTFEISEELLAKARHIAQLRGIEPNEFFVEALKLGISTAPTAAGKAWTESIDSDSPHGRSDAFNRAPFAKHVLQAIVACPKGESCVIGIEGEWGSGKTFLLQEIKRLIDEAQESTGTTQNINASDIAYLDYAPWLISGRDAIAKELLKELSIKLLTPSATKAKVGQAAAAVNGYATTAANIAKYAGLIGSASVAGGDFGALTAIGKYAEMVAKGTANISKLNVQQRSPIQLKKEITTALKTYPQKIVVFIDDIDRLPPEEIRDLMHAVKAVANFPNLIYVLAYDRKIVTQCLGHSTAEVDGASYLEKIVQLPVVLPRLAPIDLLRFFESQLKDLGISVDYSKSTSGGQRNNGVMLKLSGLLDKPRSVIRIKNALRQSYFELKDDVELIDLIAMETLRVTRPALWEFVCNHPDCVNKGVLADQFINLSHRSKIFIKAFKTPVQLANATEDIDLTVRKNDFYSKDCSRRLGADVLLAIFPDLHEEHLNGLSDSPIKAMSRGLPLLQYLSLGTSRHVLSSTHVAQLLTAQGLCDWESLIPSIRDYDKLNRLYGVLNELLAIKALHRLDEPWALLVAVSKAAAKALDDLSVEAEIGVNAGNIALALFMHEILRLSTSQSQHEVVLSEYKKAVQELPFLFVSDLRELIVSFQNQPSQWHTDADNKEFLEDYECITKKRYHQCIAEPSFLSHCIRCDEPVARAINITSEEVSREAADDLFTRLAAQDGFVAQFAKNSSRNPQGDFDKEALKLIPDLCSWIAQVSALQDPCLASYLNYLRTDATANDWMTARAKGVASS